MTNLILPVFYLAPIKYYSILLNSPSVVFEIHEHFIKQTYRNRCEIYGANGQLNLIIPIKHTGERTAMKDVRIANANNWQKIHWRSLEAAYRTSAYFEFYEHVFAPFYEKKYEFLIDFNFELKNEILKILETEISIKTTGTFQKNYSDETDFRQYFKKTLHEGAIKAIPFEKDSGWVAYPQVFSDKFGFIPNLSIFDLLFNVGNEGKKLVIGH